MEPTYQDGGRSFSRNERSWARKATFASALLLALLASGCGGGSTEETQASAAAAQAKAEPGQQEQAEASQPEPLDAAQELEIAAEAEAETDPESPVRAAAAPVAMALAPAPMKRAAAALPLDPSRAPLGVNLEGLYDWARLQPFVDLMKTARPWGTADAPWDERAAVDSLGWPTGDAGVMVNVRTFEPGDEGKPYRYLTPGIYKLKFAGRAAVTSTSTNVQVKSYRYFPATGQSTADVVVGARADALMLTFRNTLNGVRNVTLRRPGYAATDTFTNEFKQALEPFGVLRLMDFLRTNYNPVRNWSGRTKPSSATQASPKGGSYEYAIQIANELGKDIWINIPSGANDAYVRNLALLLKKGLAPGRVVYVEYSNELWNFIFPQSTENMEAAVREAIAGDKTLTNGKACTQAQFDANFGECNKYWAGYYRVGKRAVNISKIFAGVYGAGAINNQVRIVYATQFASPGIAEAVLKNIATYRGQPSAHLYGLATAPYFYLSEQLAASTSATDDQILQSLENSLRTENEPMFAAGAMENGTFVRKAYRGGVNSGASHKAMADYYGMKSLAYEGGPDLRQNHANPVAKIAANRSARMGELVSSEISQWVGCGNDLFMHFSLSSSWDKYGYWGLTNNPEPSGPKYEAARALAQRDRATLTSCR
jgi:hypothetical protein